MAKRTRIILSLLAAAVITVPTVVFALPPLQTPLLAQPPNGTIFESVPANVTLDWQAVGLSLNSSGATQNLNTASYSVTLQYCTNSESPSSPCKPSSDLWQNVTGFPVTVSQGTISTATPGTYPDLYNTSLAITSSTTPPPNTNIKQISSSIFAESGLTSFRWKVQAIAGGSPQVRSNSAVSPWHYFYFKAPPESSGDPASPLATPVLVTPLSGAAFNNDLPIKYNINATSTSFATTVSLPLRTLTLAWKPVPGATGYKVYVQYFSSTQAWTNDTYSNSNTFCGNASTLPTTITILPACGSVPCVCKTAVNNYALSVTGNENTSITFIAPINLNSEATTGLTGLGGFAMNVPAGVVEGRWAVQAIGTKNSPAPNPNSLDGWQYIAFLN